MQLNIYVPKARADLLAALDLASRATGRQKNELVLEAIEQFHRERPREMGRYPLGAVIPWKRGDLYAERLDRIAPRRDLARRQRSRRKPRP
ncbi:MAG: hypothetical protein ACT4P5_14320 [Armatimonadota bacterium]